MPGQGWPHYYAGGAIAEGQGWPRNDVAPAGPPDPADDREIAILATSPIAYWPLRTDGLEYTGNAPDLTIFGAPTFHDNGIDLNGTSDHLKALGFDPWAIADAAGGVITFCIWLGRDGIGGYQAVLGSFQSSYDIFFSTGANQLNVFDPTPSSRFSGTVATFISTVPIGPLFVEISEAFGVKTWLGDVANLTSGSVIDLSLPDEPDFAIGLDEGIHSSSTSYFPGMMSDVAIWDRALTDAERGDISGAVI